jgi:hypothetical protein
MGEMSYPDGSKSVGEFRKSSEWNTKIYNKEGNIIGRYVNGNYRNPFTFVLSSIKKII